MKLHMYEENNFHLRGIYKSIISFCIYTYVSVELNFISVKYLYIQ